MNTSIALFRGIYVGGHNRLLMKDIRAVLEGLGFFNVKTYLQSGNVVFQSGSPDSGQLSHDISQAIIEGCQMTLEVFVISLEELRSAIASHPFPEGEGDPKSLHFSFLKSRPVSPDLAKLAANVEKSLGVVLTGRNWRTVNAILSMAAEIEDD